MARSTDYERVPAPLWAPCSRGTFAALAGRLQRRQRRRTFLRWTMAASVFALTGAGVVRWLCLPSESEYHFAGLSCSEVLALVMAGMDQLQAGQMDQLRRHLSQCRRCQKRFQDLGMTL